MPKIKIEGNQIFYNEEQTTLDDLRVRLIKLDLINMEDDAAKIIKLQSAGDVPYGTYYPVWAAIVQAGGVVTIAKEAE